MHEQLWWEPEYSTYYSIPTGGPLQVVEVQGKLLLMRVNPPTAVVPANAQNEIKDIFFSLDVATTAITTSGLSAQATTSITDPLDEARSKLVTVAATLDDAAKKVS